MSGKTIVANWKMNGNKTLVEETIKKLNPIKTEHHIIICPPFTLIDQLQQGITNPNISVGGQNCHHLDSGAYTGHISAKMISEANCKHCIVGHMESRKYDGDSDAAIAQKTEAVIQNNMQPVLCIGTDKRYDFEELTQKITEECKKIFNHSKNIIAYEPVWAIGTGLSPTMEEIDIAKNTIKQNTNANTVIYGGSVSKENAAEISRHCDGLIIGKASLNIDEFIQIISDV